MAYTFNPVNSTGNQILTTSGSNGTSWSNSWVASTTVPHEALKISQTNPPTLEVKGNMVINGRDLEERLNTIEKVLMIPPRDAILEAKYPSLKKKYDEYIKALEKYSMWEHIKGDEND